MSRGRKAHLVLKAGDEDNGDEDDGDDLARRCPISFCLSSASLGPLTLSSILFYFFFSCSLSVFLQTIWPDGKKHVCFKRFSLFLHPCSFAQEVNNVRWINSSEQCQLNCTWHCSHEQYLPSDPVKKFIFLIVFYLKNWCLILFNNIT